MDKNYLQRILPTKNKFESSRAWKKKKTKKQTNKKKTC